MKIDSVVIIVFVVVIIFFLFSRRKEKFIKGAHTLPKQCNRVGYYMSKEPWNCMGCASGSSPVGSGYDTEVGGCSCDEGYGCGLGNTGQIQCLPKCKNDNDCPDGISCCGATKNTKGQCSIQCPTVWRIVGAYTYS